MEQSALKSESVVSHQLQGHIDRKNDVILGVKCSPSMTKQFFMHVSQRVVMAVVPCEKSEVTVLIARLKSWRLDMLTSHMSVSLLSWGHVGISDDGMPVHGPSLPMHGEEVDSNFTLEDTWAAVKIETKKKGNSRPLLMYAALNIGLEGWCLLTAHSYTLQHVLNTYRRSAHDLEQMRSCKTYCKIRRNFLSPIQQPVAPEVLESFRSWLPEILKAYKMLEDCKEVMVVVKPIVYYYMALSDPDSGWCLVAGVDLLKRKHRAAGCCSRNKPVVQVVKEGQDVQSYLKAITPLMKGQPESLVNKFLRNFTHVNTMTWDEAWNIVCEGKMNQG